MDAGAKPDEEADIGANTNVDAPATETRAGVGVLVEVDATGPPFAAADSGFRLSVERELLSLIAGPVL